MRGEGLTVRGARTRLLVALVALTAGILAVVQIEQPLRGLERTELTVGETPVTILARADAGRPPAVVIAHGFAGSRQIMHPIAASLAQAGYRAVVFDFPGHGRHPRPLTGSAAGREEATRHLVETTEAVLEAARTLPGTDGRVALVGHSMASDIVVRVAQRNPAVQATVAISMFSPALRPDGPRNLLVVVGEWEPRALRQEGLRALTQREGARSVAPDRTYGDLQAGTARRLVLADGVEHISVLFARDTLEESRSWLNTAFDRTGVGPLDGRGPWLALLIVAITALAWPLSALLPPAASLAGAAVGASLPWRRLWPLIAGPALATPALLAVLPTDFLPVLVGDYLAAHFFLYGALTWLALALAARRDRVALVPARGLGRALLAGLAVAACAVLLLGAALDTYFTSMWPTAARRTLALAMLAGTLPYFTAVEWLTRGPGAARGGALTATAAFLASLAVAVAIDVQALFFLIFIVPAILACFLVFGLFAHWCNARTGHPGVGAIANAVAFAWVLATVFPMIGA